MNPVQEPVSNSTKGDRRLVSNQDLNDALNTPYRDLLTGLLALLSKKQSNQQYLNSLVRCFCRYTGFKCAGLSFVQEQKWITYEAYSGFSKEYWEVSRRLFIEAGSSFFFSHSETEAALFYQTEQGTIYWPDIQQFFCETPPHQDKSFQELCAKEGLRTVALIPLSYQEAVLGILRLADPKSAQLTLAQISFLELIVPLIAESLHKIQLEEELNRLSQLKLVGEMAASVSHEVRNPMTTVRGFLQMLSVKRELVGYREYFSIMIDELDRANAIISEYLAAAKIEGNQFLKNNLKKTIVSIEPLLQANALKDNIELCLELEEVDDFIFNEKEIKQLVLNLARNGIEAMQHHGRLIIKTFQRGDSVTLLIRDNGGGIPPEVLPKLGTPFVTTKLAGTGLGLSVCYSIAAKHQAVLSVDSTGSEGTSISVKFPVVNNVPV
ncbi:GAF domain-containing sensor histidine kinase [bacterium BFN5]|nr:GAF domain-containing sensor histidine kinase [bacterium BFN5]